METIKTEEKKKFNRVYDSNKSNYGKIANTGDVIARREHCCLCRKNKANKTGSHIIPQFLMRMVNAKVGTKGRDHEIGFNITNDGIHPYFGRSIYEEDRRRITDKEDKITDTTNLDVIDYIYCEECEKLFSKYESKYARSLNVNNLEKKVVINIRLTGEEAMLFWASVVWRISSTSFFNEKLPQKFEDSLRQMLITGKVENDISYILFTKVSHTKESPHRAAIPCLVEP